MNSAKLRAPKETGPNIHVHLAPTKPTAAYDTYWHFAAERQRIFFARMQQSVEPWTNDPVLQEYKFTNAYRAADRVSQYLIRRVIYRGDNDPVQMFFRIILFKIFNRIDTWELLEQRFGEIRYEPDFVANFDETLTKAMGRGTRIYSPAYIMPSGGRLNQTGRKHRMHLELIDRMVRDRLPHKLMKARSMQDAFGLLRGYPTIGDFLGYQYVTDLNYSPLLNFDENHFVIPGPGALSGIAKCFSDLGGFSETEIIKRVTQKQEEEFALRGLNFQTLWGRRLQLIDCQNLFCEVDKYCRVAHPEFGTGRKRIKQRFAPKTQPVHYFFPPKWGLNEKIPIQLRFHDSLF